jgi:hypothetical protein
MFSGSQHFVVTGGIFHNITKNYVNINAPTVFPGMFESFRPIQGKSNNMIDFRTIPLGDINLQAEIDLNRGSRVVDRTRDRGSVRRVYSARVMGLEGNMTVAMYQGDGAEEVRLNPLV